MSLKEYKRKRKFHQTPEPKGRKQKSAKGNLRFVVQMHNAQRLHFDLRLEMDGVFKSWAVPKGPSLNPQDQRLAVFVEDHPLEYGSFEGIIPKGNYGAGTVMVWDEGTYIERSSEGLEKGHITFVLEGQKLHGEFALIKLKKDAGQKAWLLVKKRDEHSSTKMYQTFSPRSAKTGRTMKQIEAQAEEAGDIWISKKNKPTAKAPRLTKDPMPRKIKPMIATQGQTLDSKEWILEPQLEGLRAISEVEARRVHLYSKSGLPFEKKFPAVVDELAQLGVNAVFDGELVGKNYHIYDILYFDGKDLRQSTLADRKIILKSAFKNSKHIHHVSTPKKNQAVVAKNPLSTYHSGTSSDWLKLAHPTTQKKFAVDPEQARLTHLDKIYFPLDGYTKGDVLNYYEKVADHILPYLKDRPESLSRHPDGIHRPGFYQKDMTGHIPRWFKTQRIFSESADKSIDYPVVQDKRSLLYIVNLGCIEIHPWFSRIHNIDNPDFLVIDLDPDDNSFEDVMKIALEFHQLLDGIGAPNFCKTSGATGLHIGVPTEAKYDFETVRDFAEKVSRVVMKKYPALTSMERTPARRKKKIYLDCLQNRRGQTLAAPFCIRPRDGAPVSMPLTWKELTPRLKPEQFNIENALGRIQKTKDPWTGVLGPGADLKKCLRLLEKKRNKA